VVETGVAAEVVEVAKTEVTITKVKTIIRIDKDNTTTKEDLKDSNSNSQACLNHQLKRLHSKCSSSQQLKCK